MWWCYRMMATGRVWSVSLEKGRFDQRFCFMKLSDRWRNECVNIKNPGIDVNKAVTFTNSKEVVLSLFYNILSWKLHLFVCWESLSYIHEWFSYQKTLFLSLLYCYEFFGISMIQVFLGKDDISQFIIIGALERK